MTIAAPIVLVQTSARSALANVPAVVTNLNAVPPWKIHCSTTRC